MLLLVSFQVFVERYQGFKALGAGYQERSRPVQLKAIILLTDILHEQVCLVLNHENLPMFLALSATRNMATGVRVHILVTSVHYTNILIWF